MGILPLRLSWLLLLAFSLGGCQPSERVASLPDAGLPQPSAQTTLLPTLPEEPSVEPIDPPEPAPPVVLPMTRQPNALPIPADALLESEAEEGRLLTIRANLQALEQQYRSLGYQVQSHDRGFFILSEETNSMIQGMARPDGTVELLVGPRTASEPSTKAAPEEPVTQPAKARMVRQRLESGNRNISDLLQ